MLMTGGIPADSSSSLALSTRLLYTRGMGFTEMCRPREISNRKHTGMMCNWILE